MCNAKEIKKQKILEAAYKLFVQNGYHNTKIIDIAVEAGIGKGTVYEYFDSKENLLLDIVSSGIEEHFVDCERVLEIEGTQTEKLLELVMVGTRYSKKNAERMITIMMMVFDTNDGMPKAFISKAHDIWKQEYTIMNQIIAKGIETGEFRKLNIDMVTVAIMGTIEGYLKTKYGVGQVCGKKLPFNVDSFEIQDLIELILKGIQA